MHWLTLYVGTYIGAALGLAGPLYWTVVLIHLAAIPFIGLAMFRFYEQPVMAFLRQRLLRKG